MKTCVNDAQRLKDKCPLLEISEIFKDKNFTEDVLTKELSLFQKPTSELAAAPIPVKRLSKQCEWTRNRCKLVDVQAMLKANPTRPAVPLFW